MIGGSNPSSPAKPLKFDILIMKMPKRQAFSFYRTFLAIAVVVLWFIALAVSRFTIDVFWHYDSTAPKEQGDPIIIGLFSGGISIALIVASIAATKALVLANKKPPDIQPSI